MTPSKTLISDYVFNVLPYLFFDLKTFFKLNQFVTICHFSLLLFAPRSPPSPTCSTTLMGTGAALQ